MKYDMLCFCRCLIIVVVIIGVVVIGGGRIKCANAEETAIHILDGAAVLSVQHHYTEGRTEKRLELKTPPGQPIRKFAADVTILQAANTGGRLRAQVELLYQPEQYRSGGQSLQDLIAARAEIRDEGKGLQLRGYVLACRNATCSQRYDLPKPSGNYPSKKPIHLNEAHTLGVEYHDKTNTFQITYDGRTKHIDMTDLVKQEQFDPTTFVRAKLKVFIDKIDTKGEKGLMHVRFDNVYVNDERYDDFHGETIDMQKWEID